VHRYVVHRDTAHHDRISRRCPWRMRATPRAVKAGAPVVPGARIGGATCGVRVRVCGVCVRACVCARAMTRFHNRTPASAAVRAAKEAALAAKEAALAAGLRPSRGPDITGWLTCRLCRRGDFHSEQSLKAHLYKNKVRVPRMIYIYIYVYILLAHSLSDWGRWGEGTEGER
jgi:hypothetical protein